MMIKKCFQYFMLRNLTRAQRHSGRQIRHEAGAVDRVQRKVSSLTCHVSHPLSRVTCQVDQIYSHLVQHRDPQPRFDFLRSAPPAPSPGAGTDGSKHTAVLVYCDIMMDLKSKI